MATKAKVKVPVNLREKDYARLKEIAKVAGVSKDTVVNVMLAAFIVNSSHAQKGELAL